MTGCGPWQIIPPSLSGRDRCIFGLTRWNRIMTRRVSKKHNHAIKIKAKVRARGTRSQHWYPESRVQILRKKCRTQSLWNLHLAGDWHHNSETMPLGPKPRMMRSPTLRPHDFDGKPQPAAGVGSQIQGPWPILDMCALPGKTFSGPCGECKSDFG